MTSILNQFQYTYEKDSVSIYGNIVVGASGAVTSFSGGGIGSVVKETTAGQYTITLSQLFQRLFDVEVKPVLGTISGVAKVQLLMTPATLQADVKADGAITVQCVDVDGAAVNPASGENLMVKIVCRKTSVGPFDA